MSQSTDVKPALAAAVASVLTGVSVVATRYVVFEIDPLSLAFLRYGGAALCLLPVALILRAGTIARRDWPAVAALGVLFFGLFPWTFNAALQYTTAARGALLITVMPLITLGLASALGIEALTRRKLAGILLALAGVALALSDRLFLPDGDAPGWLGDGLMLVTATLGALYSVFSRRYLARYPALGFTALCMLCGALALLIPAGGAGLAGKLGAISAGGWLIVAYLAVIGSAITFWLYTWALSRRAPSRVAVFYALNPVTAMALGALILDEPLTLGLLAGSAAVIAGILLAQGGPAEAK